ncbi:hypothetical protein GLOIN_2v1765743 [Rhizophagus clarus]|uniref:Uncharacterized protein n=1 Tax=Rhizophagus clarus TaxID=94130 RepID=A0A8H3QX19_9GLOM|nr:hypothetical protein GLOIN_2v1765743 [Rhizophagus clarus]
MRILPKSAREIKEQFFRKQEWTLHTILVFTKHDNSQLNVHTFDHWSTDTKQDAQFTASSFDAVFEMLDPKPNNEKIKDAIKKLGGTSVAYLRPKCNHVPVKMISGITKLLYFEWPIEGSFTGYIQAQTLPCIDE